MAWLNAIPEKPQNDRSGTQPQSRLEQYRSEVGGSPDMPPVGVPDYLIGYLFDVGPVLSGGMGPIVVSHSELLAWQHNTGVELRPWETGIIRRLSGDYLSELRKAEKPDCPSPWSPVDMTEANRRAVARKVQDALRSRMSTSKQG